MLIVSKFHDYYDTAIAYGIDKKTVYNRKTDTFELKRESFISSRDRDFWSKGVCYTPHAYIIGFAGELYPLVTFSTNGGDTKYFYRASELFSFLESINYDLRKSDWRYSPFIRSIDGINSFFKKENTQDFASFFRKYNAPTFIIEGIGYWQERVIVNPMLKEYSFQKVKDPFTAFQDIYLYISGVLGNEMEKITEISDKYKIKQHGFFEYSFKKLPSKKKGKCK